MKRSFLVSFLIFFSVLQNGSFYAQGNYKNSRIDTLIFRSVGSVVDTFYLTRELIGDNVYRQVSYYGFSNNTNLSSFIDTLIIGSSAWYKIYKDTTVPFLSVKDFNAKKITKEYIDTTNKEIFYYEYQPVKRIKVKRKLLYLYRVRPMSGGRMVEGLGDDIRHIVFDFSIGEIYRSSFRIEKVLTGYETYIKYIKW